MFQIVLASSSPRRRQLLQKAGFAFRTLSVEISENISENISLDDALMALSRQKAQAVFQTYGDKLEKNTILLSADTSVVFEGKVLGKPKDQFEATEFLSQMAGKSHIVKTAFCLWNLAEDLVYTEVVNSTVYFKAYDANLIASYVATSEPYDKAGGYGIQGKGRDFVAKYEGPFDNIVGLPVKNIEAALLSKNWQVERR